jgi:hypothetical protein
VKVYGPLLLHCKPPQLLNFEFDSNPDHAFDSDADPDPAFHSDADQTQDQAFKNDADPCGSGSGAATLHTDSAKVLCRRTLRLTQTVVTCDWQQSDSLTFLSNRMPCAKQDLQRGASDF